MSDTNPKTIETIRANANTREQRVQRLAKIAGELLQIGEDTVSEYLARDAEIARLTAELADTDRLVAAAIDTGAADRARAMTAEATVERLTAELAAEREELALARKGCRSYAERIKRETEAARREGARDERGLCLADIATIQRAPHPEYSGAIRVLGQAIDAIRARGDAAIDLRMASGRHATDNGRETSGDV